MRRKHRAAAWLAAAVLCTAAHGPSAAMDELAARYVKLVLAVGVHDPDYVDAYYGPPEWRAAAVTARRELAELDADAAELLAAIESEAVPAHRRRAGAAPARVSDDAGAFAARPSRDAARPALHVRRRIGSAL